MRREAQLRSTETCRFSTSKVRWRCPSPSLCPSQRAALSSKSHTLSRQNSGRAFPIIIVLTYRLLEAATKSVISSYKISRILFCARGPADSEESSCFAFTCSHGESEADVLFQCHVFRCNTDELVRRVPSC